MDLDFILEGGKWVLLVLVTGFVAQFGKKFAEYLIDRRKKKNAESDKKEISAPAGNASISEYNNKSGMKTEKELQKLEKKKLKAETKKLKKQKEK